MTKELIVSANVHEKKVAIIEDGVVTEFYVERRDENQGVVGNLYKGRVMKVLPGMQSAFVDIGLERDAFLYVSDFTEFMEEEEEIDFKETPESSRAAQAPQRATERSRRHERPQPEAASVQSLSEPYKEEETGERPVPIEDVVEQLAEIADESLIPPPPPEEELGEETEAAVEAEIPQAEIWTAERVLDEPLEADTASAVEEESAVGAEEVSAGPSPSEEEVSTATGRKAKRGRSRKKAEPAETTKTGRGEKKKTKAEAAETGKRKTSRTTSRRGSRKQATEAESEAERARIEEAAGPSFERITDEDVAQDAGELLKDAIVQEKIIEQVHNAEYRTGFVPAEPEPEWRVGSFRSRFGEGTGFQRVVDEGSDTAAKSDEQDNMAGQMSDATESVVPSEAGETEPFEHVSEFFSENTFDQARQESMDETTFNTDSRPEISEE
ncbi:MAG TPA: hypothetical protein VFQ92_01125, partial [Blastocatellia bacterium]|nr:hypothetical protein [Blastocatellia bacterium]